MFTYQPTQPSLTIALILGLSLQSCTSALKLAHHPLNQRPNNEQGALPNPVYLENLQPSSISAYTFSASCGKLINFFQQAGLWKARVQDPGGVSRVLPVVCNPQKQLLPSLQRFAQQGRSLQKQHIHVLNSEQPIQAQYVFVGKLAVKGGMLETEEANPATLHEAITQGDLALVQTFLVLGADPNIPDGNGLTPLQLATIKGDLAMVTLLLERGADPTIADESGLTLLPWAADNGHLELVNLLLEKFPQLHVVATNDLPALNLAIQQGHLAIARLLLAKGANPNTITASGYTALHCAVVDGHLDIATLLLEKGAEVDATGLNDSTPLHLAIDQGHVEIVRLLLAKGANPNAATADAYTALHRAAVDDHLEIATLLLQKGAELHAVDLNGLTPLHLAIEQGHIAMVSLLLAKEANLNVATANGCTPLNLAAADDRLEIANLLLEKGADPTIADDQQRTPLHIAAYKGHMPIISRLLLHSIDTNAQDNHGNTLLHALLESTNLTPEERLHNFIEAIKGIEINHHTVLNKVEAIMPDSCPELTNNSDTTRSILTMIVDYIQGINLTLKNQDDRSTLAIIQELLKEAPKSQEYATLVKILDQHQELGGWIRSHT